MQNWDDLRFFLAVARTGSLSAAARLLDVSQPTVGRRVTAFEEELGAKLFVPTATGQELTATGRRMLSHAEQMEAEVTAATRIAYGRDAGLRGRVKIAASEWMVTSVLSPLMGPLCARYPALELELHSDTQHLSLGRRETDLALRPSSFEEPDVLQRELGQLSFGLYASDGYLATHGSPDFAAHCEGHALIAMSESLDKVPDRAWLPTFASKARVVVRTNGREPMVALASSGIGIACLPRFLGDRAPGLRRLSPPTPEPERVLWIGVHRDTRSVPRVRVIFNALIEAFKRFHAALSP